MKLSTRNQLAGTVVSVAKGEAMAVVKVRLDGADQVLTSITRDAADDLGLSEGSAVTLLIKATEVSLAVRVTPAAQNACLAQLPRSGGT